MDNERKGTTTIEIMKEGPNFVLCLHKTIEGETPIRMTNLRRVEIFLSLLPERFPTAYVESFDESVCAISMSITHRIEYIGFKPQFKIVDVGNPGNVNGNFVWENRWNSLSGLIIFKLSIPFEAKIPYEHILRE